MNLKREKGLRNITSCSLLTLLLMAGLISSVPKALAIPNIYVDPSVVYCEPLETFVIALKITGAVDVFAWEAHLSWTARVLNVTNIVEGAFFSLQPQGSFFVKVIYEDNIGSMDNLTVACTTIGSHPGASGDGTLALITFLVERRSETALDLYDTKLRDSSTPSPLPIEHTSSDGFFESIGVQAVDIDLDVGVIHFRGETAEFCMLTVYQGDIINATALETTLYKPGGSKVPLSVQQIATGLYKAVYEIPVDAPVGTYALVVECDFAVATVIAKGASLKTFLLSSSLTGWNARLVSIDDMVAGIQTDTAIIKANLTTIGAKITSIDGNIATIETDVGTIKADVNTVKIESIPSLVDDQKSQGTNLYIDIALSLLAAAGAIGALALILRKRKQT